MGSTRNKLTKFEYIQQCDFVLEQGKELFETIKGDWSTFFGNNNPITLELGCGKGEYTNGLAKEFPDRNFIGVDIKGTRLWKGVQIAEQEGNKNVAFLRTQILLIERFFEPGEVDEIWITFPDPRPRDRDIRRRLTFPRFLKMYNNILKEGGYIHLKTDSEGLFDYTLEIMKEENKEIVHVTKDLYKHPDLLKDHHGIQTTFEKKFLQEGVPIKYLKFVG